MSRHRSLKMDREAGSKNGKIVGLMGGLLLGITGITMLFTNPNQKEYESYATEMLSDYLKQEVCTQIAQELGGILTSYCKTIVDTGRPQIQQIIGQKTVRANYLLFSIYDTKLFMPSPVPSYQFSTIGVLHNFYIYRAEEI